MSPDISPDTGWVAALLVAIGVALSKVFDFALAWRNHAGTVNTTDAEALWAENAKIREYMAKELERVRIDQVRLLKENDELRTLNALLQSEIAGLKAKNVALEERIDAMRGRLGEASSV